MKRFKKFIKIVSISLVFIFISALISSASFFFVTTNGLALDTEKLEESSSQTNLQIFDYKNNLIIPSSSNYIPLTKLSSDTKNAFISAEDKRYYSHKGIDYIRIGGAIISNIKNRSFSEGASTISQQLIKNTQLSSEKTIKRKLKEISLTKKLEKEYSKEQILEMYLNNIYFGNGCYGVENASRHYFNKSASELSLAESALLAGTINAPSVYDIENHTEVAIKRRNLILSLMKKYKKISESDYNKAIIEPVSLNIIKLANNNYLYNEILEEACKKLKTTENNIKNKKVKIYTNVNLDLNNKITETISNNYKNLQNSTNISAIVVENHSNKIISVIGNKQVLASKKQPGSTIKPVLVYAPAIEKGMISPATKILDEKINISGYSPENADKKYHGYVSVRESLKNSYNIPAVKILNELGIKNAHSFANKLNINFENSDNNLAIALGGFTNGVTLKTLCDAYTAFADNGKFAVSSYITKIDDNNGKTIYHSSNEKSSVMSESTAYLITDMLKDCAKSGTAKRLRDFDFEIASKTGTVGEAGSKLNSDAYNICYTSEHTIISYVGGKNMNESINGATYPTLISKNILELLYKNTSPKNFDIPSSVSKISINKNDYDNNIISQTEQSNNSITEIFSKSNLPPKTDNTLSLKLEVINQHDKKPILCFYASNNYNYNIIRKNKTKEETISSLVGDFESKIIKFEDISAKNTEIYEYFVEICDKYNNHKFNTNSVKLKPY